MCFEICSLALFLCRLAEKNDILEPFTTPTLLFGDVNKKYDNLPQITPPPPLLLAQTTATTRTASTANINFSGKKTAQIRVEIPKNAFAELFGNYIGSKIGVFVPPVDVIPSKDTSVAHAVLEKYGSGTQNQNVNPPTILVYKELDGISFGEVRKSLNNMMQQVYAQENENLDPMGDQYGQAGSPSSQGDDRKHRILISNENDDDISHIGVDTGLNDDINHGNNSNNIDIIVNENGDKYLRNCYGNEMCDSDRTYLDLLITDILKHAVYRDRFKMANIGLNSNTKNRGGRTDTPFPGRSKLWQKNCDKTISNTNYKSINIPKMHNNIVNNDKIRFIANIFGPTMAFKLSSEGKSIIKDLGMIFAFDLFLFNKTRFPLSLPFAGEHATLDNGNGDAICISTDEEGDSALYAMRNPLMGVSAQTKNRHGSGVGLRQSFSDPSSPMMLSNDSDADLQMISNDKDHNSKNKTSTTNKGRKCNSNSVARGDGSHVKTKQQLRGIEKQNKEYQYIDRLSKVLDALEEFCKDDSLVKDLIEKNRQCIFSNNKNDENDEKMDKKDANDRDTTHDRSPSTCHLLPKTKNKQTLTSKHKKSKSKPTLVLKKGTSHNENVTARPNSIGNLKFLEQGYLDIKMIDKYSIYEKCLLPISEFLYYHCGFDFFIYLYLYEKYKNVSVFGKAYLRGGNSKNRGVSNHNISHLLDKMNGIRVNKREIYNKFYAMRDNMLLMISKLVCQGILIGISEISNTIERKDIEKILKDILSIDENMCGKELIGSGNEKNSVKSSRAEYGQTEAIDKMNDILELFGSFAGKINTNDLYNENFISNIDVYIGDVISNGCKFIQNENIRVKGMTFSDYSRSKFDKKFVSKIKNNGKTQKCAKKRVQFGNKVVVSKIITQSEESDTMDSNASSNDENSILSIKGVISPSNGMFNIESSYNEMNSNAYMYSASPVIYHQEGSPSPGPHPVSDDDLFQGKHASNQRVSRRAVFD